jgi:hypothetical protein
VGVRCTRAVLVLVAVGMLAACRGGEGEPPEEMLASADQDLDWDPPLTVTSTSTAGASDDGDLRVAFVLRNVSGDHALRLGGSTFAGMTGVMVRQVGFEPVATPEEPIIEWPSEDTIGVIDSIAVPPRHHVVLRAELTVDCDVTPAGDLEFVATDGVVRTTVAAGDLSAPRAIGWPEEVVGTVCGER